FFFSSRRRHTRFSRDWSSDVCSSDLRICKERTGLDATFTALGSGFFRVFEDDKLESFTNFTLLVCEDVQGELHSDDELAEYFWRSEERRVGKECRRRGSPCRTVKQDA